MPRGQRACAHAEQACVRVRTASYSMRGSSMELQLLSRQTHPMMHAPDAALGHAPLPCGYSGDLTQQVCTPTGRVSRTASYKSLPPDTKRMFAEFAQARGYGLLQEAR